MQRTDIINHAQIVTINHTSKLAKTQRP